MRNVYTIDPLEDARWSCLLARHSQSSIFHTPGWLAALRKTYGYEPVAYTTSAPGEDLTNALLFCRVRSWLAGSRIVSLPFSDHCEPLTHRAEDLELLITTLDNERREKKWKYVELRLQAPEVLSNSGTRFSNNQEFYFHVLDLRPEAESLFRNFHKSCIQRKIHRAERERLSYEEGRSEELLRKFYRLQLMTRRRHQLPPQPLSWFRNLTTCLGEKLSIRVVSKDHQPIAGMITLLHKETLVYKYGCSDLEYHNLGGMPFLFWKAIQEGKKAGALQFDLGRSDTDNPGLVAFKSHLGAQCSKLYYFRAGHGASQALTTNPFIHSKSRLFRRAFAYIPNPLLKVAGNLLYRHVA